MSLRERFPVLFNLAIHKDVKVVYSWDVRPGTWTSGNPRFSQTFSEWEMERLEEFCSS